METEKIIFFRNLLFRIFFVGVLFAIFFGLVTIALWDTLTPIAANVFRIEPAEMGALVVAFFMDVRIVLVFGMLAPAIALHWMAKSKK